MKKITKLITVIALLAATIPQINSFKCGTFCYKQNSVNGQCYICFNQCANSELTTFNSCHINSQSNSDSQVLSQTLCKSKCYPDQFSSWVDEPQKNPNNILNPINIDQTENEKMPNQNEPVQYTADELKKINKQHEGWSFPISKQNIAGAIAWFIVIELIFIGCFIAIKRYLSKQQALKQLAQSNKKQKQWVKKFQKVNNDQSTLSSPSTQKSAQITQSTE